ncbi:MAG: ABC transporter permease subunit [Ancrocorticia sp.]|jgi:osmoprotectant transport system permease protein|nr:ABC transporter permease subunit [Ancrocorticia sp.]MCI2002047.1 ABC transporter permease subunit [Ancrocorticia sp.]MCI2012467.1 ABC transporter permease subunit [Ancrocorticia sp.]
MMRISLPGLWAIQNWSSVSELLVQHIWLVVVPTIVGLAIAVPLGLLLYDSPKVRSVVTVVVSAIYTIPSLALFLLIPGIIGTQILSPVNVVVALSLYSTCLLLRSVFQSLDNVPADVLDAGTAIGFSRLQRKLRIDLPLVIPVLTAGVRVVVVTNVSLVSVGAVIGIGGLGQLFTSGYQRNFPEEIMTGIILTVILAAIADRIIAILGRALTPWRSSQGSGARPSEAAEPAANAADAVSDLVNLEA